MIKNIDYHDGYLQAMSDLKQYTKICDTFADGKIREHTAAITSIMDSWYDAHKEDDKRRS